MSTAADLNGILNRISEDPNDAHHWISLVCWLSEQGKNDESNAVRVLWPMLRDNLRFATLEATLVDVARNAKVLAAIARKVERQADDTPPV
jgi:hypothetical protein